MNSLSDKMRHIDDRGAIEIGRYTRIDLINQGSLLALASKGWAIASRYATGSRGLAQTVGYKVLKTTLRAEIDPDAWATLNSDTSRPFSKPSTGRFAVKVINHLGDEVMKVFKV